MNMLTIELRRSTALSAAQIFRSHDHAMSVSIPHEVDEFLGRPEFITVAVANGKRLERPSG